MNQPNIVEITSLQKSFGKQSVLAGVNLEVGAGTVFALLGPNGAGKTTLINILSTLIAPDAGTARVNGFDVVAQKTEVRRSISLTGQYAAVDEILTGQENLRMMGRLNGLSAIASRTRTEELLHQFDLDVAAGKRIKDYSGGMRRRLDLAISLLTPAPVIFLDEPTTGLDTRSRQALWQVIKELAGQGLTILLTTQYLEEADQLADRIAVINHGVVVAQGSAAELKAQVGGEVIELRDENEHLLHEIATDGTVRGLQTALDRLDQQLLDHVQIGIRKPSMDDVFLALTETPELEIAS